MSESEPNPPPPLTESARSVYEAARQVAAAWGGQFAALRRLLAADFALARTALVQGLVLLFVAAILFGTAWVLLTVLAVWAMHSAGLGWALSIGLPLLLSTALGTLAIWHASRALKLADMEASRHEVSQWVAALGATTESPRADASTDRTL
ncbi:MAG TPA: hypothetical protein VK753_01285 [Xanthomonadaceae bacterium]|nr:hypothetical protein [Xanthomonadaceae bacterium]